MKESEKTVLRNRVRREGIRVTAEASGIIRERLRGLTWFQKARSVLSFHPLPGEADLLPLLESEPAKQWVFPRVDGDNLSLHEWHPSHSWLAGAFGIREPDPLAWPEASPGEIDLALIPGLAFDSRGGRLGRGKGFYDRFLGSDGFPGLKIGIGPLLESVPIGDHDIGMDAVLAPEGLFLVSGRVLDKATESR